MTHTEEKCIYVFTYMPLNILDHYKQSIEAQLNQKQND